MASFAFTEAAWTNMSNVYVSVSFLTNMSKNCIKLNQIYIYLGEMEDISPHCGIWFTITVI